MGVAQITPGQGDAAAVAAGDEALQRLREHRHGLGVVPELVVRDAGVHQGIPFHLQVADAGGLCVGLEQQREGILFVAEAQFGGPERDQGAQLRPGRRAHFVGP
jgi:hypothetical protein